MTSTTENSTLQNFGSAACKNQLQCCAAVRSFWKRIKQNSVTYNSVNWFIYQFIYWMQSPNDIATAPSQTVSVKNPLIYKSRQNSQVLHSELQRTPWYSFPTAWQSHENMCLLWPQNEASVTVNNLLNCDSRSFFSYVSQAAVNNDDIKNYHTGVSELTPYLYQQGSSHLLQLLFQFLYNLT